MTKNMTLQEWIQELVDRNQGEVPFLELFVDHPGEFEDEEVIEESVTIDAYLGDQEKISQWQNNKSIWWNPAGGWK